MKYALLVTLLLGIGMAQDKPKPSEVQRPTLTEVQRLKLLTAYQKALLAQAESNQAQAKLNEAVNAYNSYATSVRDEAGFPNGTSFQVNIETGVVTPQAPPKQEEKKK